MYNIKYNNLIDTHAHIQGGTLYEDRENVIKRAELAGVKKIIVVGTNLKDSKIAIELANEYENIYAAVGVHPHDCNNIDKKYIDEVFALSSHKKCKAIGEIGLDYYRDYTPFNIQKEFLNYQLSLAEKLNLPVIIHVRKAFDDLFSILENYKVNAVFHCFSGNIPIMKKVIENGYMISFTGSITYKSKKGISKMEKVIKEIPLDKIMVETDCPYLSPVPLRGKKNEPAHIIHTVAAIADFKNISPKDIETATTLNAINFFRL